LSIQLDLADPAIKTKIAELPEKMLDFALEVLLKQAQLMKGLAQVYVAVDTGSLRDSIRVERGGEGAHWRQVRVRAGGYVTNPKTGRLVNYALIQEIRHPYMQPAYDAVKPTITQMLQTGVVEKINERNR
jgi:hypothetical protein